MMAVPLRTRGQSLTLVLLTLLFALLGTVAALVPPSNLPTATTTQSFNPAFLHKPPRPTYTGIHKRQDTAPKPTATDTSIGPVLPSTNVTVVPPTSTGATLPVTTVPTGTTTTTSPLLNTTTPVSTTSRSTTTIAQNTTSVATSTTPAPTESNTQKKSNDTSLIIGGAVVGGLIFAIGLALLAFRCTVNRKEKQQRNKEMAATLAESFDRSAGDPIASPRKGYMELGEGPPTPSSGRGANLSRNGSQDAYYGKEGDVQDHYNSHYVQERYGGANTGGGYYDETELSVMGGHSGRPASPFMGRSNSDHSMAYPPTSISTNHYAGYNEYGHNGDYDNHGGHYGGGGYGGRPQGY
ncbi:hypothetical protein BGZ95_000444 [Linnemannia exigua]|uniref:Uncharacterized protein n=1 Tax=Linnemannia exigua TaxID=604196 RepID=A0AAD4DJC0_9FUNG|nr:hypothetical protein BGZ95_000444 [Linnemannia exigua]